MQTEEEFFIRPVSLPPLASVSSIKASVGGSTGNSTETPEFAALLEGLQSATSPQEKATVCKVLVASINARKDVTVPALPANLLRWLWHTAVYDQAASPAAVAAWGAIMGLAMAAQGSTTPSTTWHPAQPLMQHVRCLLEAVADAAEEAGDDATTTTPAVAATIAAANGGGILPWTPSFDDLLQVVQSWGGRRLWLAPCDALLVAAGLIDPGTTGEAVLERLSGDATVVVSTQPQAPLLSQRHAAVSAALHCFTVALAAAPLRHTLANIQRSAALVLRLSLDPGFSGTSMPRLAAVPVPIGASEAALPPLVPGADLPDLTSPLAAAAAAAGVAFAGPGGVIGTALCVACVVGDGMEEAASVLDLPCLAEGDPTTRWHGFDTSAGSVEAPPGACELWEDVDHAKDTGASLAVRQAAKALRSGLPPDEQAEATCTEHLARLQQLLGSSSAPVATLISLTGDTGPTAHAWVHGVVQAVINMVALSVDAVRAHLTSSAFPLHPLPTAGMYATADPDAMQGLTLDGFVQYMVGQKSAFREQYVDVWSPEKRVWETHEVTKYSPPGTYTREENGKAVTYRTYIPTFDAINADTGTLRDLDPVAVLVRPTLLPSSCLENRHQVPQAYLAPGREAFLPPKDDADAWQGLDYEMVKERLDNAPAGAAPLSHPGSVLSQATFNTPGSAQSHPGEHHIWSMLASLPGGGRAMAPVDALRRRLLFCALQALLVGGDTTLARSARQHAQRAEEAALNSSAKDAETRAALELAAAKSGQGTLRFASTRRAAGVEDLGGGGIPAPASDTFGEQVQKAASWAVQQVTPMQDVLCTSRAAVPVVLHMPFKLKVRSILAVSSLIVVSEPEPPAGAVKLPGGVYGPFYSRLSTLIALLFELTQHLWRRREDEEEEQAAAFTGHIKAPHPDSITKLATIFSDWVRPLQTKARAAGAVQQQVQRIVQRLDVLRRQAEEQRQSVGLE